MKKMKEQFLIIYETVDGTSYQLAQTYDEALGWCRHEITDLQASHGGKPLFDPKDVENWLSNGQGSPLGCKYGSIQIVTVPFI
jgi:hypothetical protein